MSSTVTAHFHVDPWKLRQLGAFDAPLDGPDAPVYIDPRFFRQTQVAEFQNAMSLVGKHFGVVLAEIELAKRLGGEDGTKIREHAKDLLRFPELEGLRIGFGKGGGHGKGFGKKRATDLFKLAEQFVTDDFHDPLLLEMFTVVQPGIGADLVSDMLAFITRDALYEFSSRVGRELHLPAQEYAVGEAKYLLPWNPKQNEPILFPPHDALADIPAFARSKKFDRFTFNNPAIRKAVSDWIKAHGSVDARKFLLANRSFVNTALSAYKSSPPTVHDAFAGKDGARLAALEVYESLKPSLSRLNPPATAGELEAAVAELCMRFRTHVEAGKSRRHLHGDRKPRTEKFLQDMFGLLADTFCEDRDIRLTREADDGAGPVDFLFSRGAGVACVLEMKLSSNTALVPTYHHQVEAYAQASRARAGFFLVVDLQGEAKRLEHLVKADADAAAASRRRPRLIIVDGRESPSASKIRKAREPLPQPIAHRPTSPPPPKSFIELLAEGLERAAQRMEDTKRAPPRRP